MPYKIFGCKVNKFYINQRLAYYGNKPDTFLIATCVVTDRAKNKRLKEALKALKSWMHIAITGCGTLEKGKLISEADFFSIYPELLAYQGKIELLGEGPALWTTPPPFEYLPWQGGKLYGNEDKENVQFTPQYSGEGAWGVKFTKAEEGVAIQKQKWLANGYLYTKHFILIQNGCDNHCSFCLTVKKRGPHRSRPLADIITEIQQIEAQGGKEIVLTGINLAARGCTNTKNPTETQFPLLLEAILKQTTLPRIRISSIGPEYANDHFFEVVQDERILPHFHYSIQSFSDNILKGMRRNYDRKQLDEILHKTKKLKKIPLAVSPDGEENLISIGADLIVGFPGETESDFLETLHAIKDYNITKLHAFPFSDHHKGENVPASLYPDQVPQEIKKERESRLLEIGDKVRNDFIAKNKGTTHQVLIEEHKQGKWRGRTENYIQVEIEGDYHKGEIISYTFT